MVERIQDPRFGQPFVAKHAAVASPNNLATVIGNKILESGGNAVDSMVAVNAALGVVFPHMTGAGGDAFWLIYDAKTGKEYSLNASGRAASSVSGKDYKGKDAIDDRGVRSAITVPGAVDGWYQAHRSFGKIPFAECLKPAIDYAKDGFPVSESLAKFSEEKLNLLRQDPDMAKIYLKSGVAPCLPGEIMRNPDLAATLEAVASNGRDAFYKGEVAKKVDGYMKEEGGFLSYDDFAAHESTWSDPLFVAYQGKTVSAPPPNSDGMATLQILGMLDNIDFNKNVKTHSDFIDIFTRATVLAFEDRNDFLTDPDFQEVPTTELLDEEYLKERAGTLLREDISDAPEEDINAEGDTTFSCAADEDGNVVGVIQSLYWEWGSGVIPEDTGVILQNRGSFFSLDSKSPNYLEPEKRPGHTLTCSIVTGEEGPEMVVGAMGGDGQPQTQATLITRTIAQGLNPQQAIDLPRWLLGRTWGEKHNGLRLEGRYNEETISNLDKLGHEQVSLIEAYSDLVGHAQAIRVYKDRYEAAADPRALGSALGY